MSDLTAYDDETPALSPSVGKQLVDESPLHGYTFHRLLGGLKKKSTDAQVLGQLYHAGLYEAGEGVAVLDFDAFRSKDAKAARLPRKEFERILSAVMGSLVTGDLACG